MSENIPYGTQNPEPPAEPLTREEQYLSAIAGVTPATDIPPVPLTRVEKYLNKIVENGGGGGGGGTSNYNALENKPQINSHELSGDKSSSDLGLQDALTETQLAAVNSGITSSGLTQIETNISSIKDKSDRIVMDANESTILYFQSTQPSNPSDGDIWIG